MLNKYLFIDEFKCDLCEFRAQSLSGLKKHKASSAHKPNTVYYCAECGKSFKVKRIFMKHIEIHLKVKKSTCKICGEENENIEDLSTHMKAYHSEHKDLGGSPRRLAEADSDDYERVNTIKCEEDNGENPLTETIESEILKLEETKIEPLDSKDEILDTILRQSLQDGDLTRDEIVDPTEILQSISYPILLTKDEDKHISNLGNSNEIVDDIKIKVEKHDLENIDLTEETIEAFPNFKSEKSLVPVSGETNIPSISIQCAECGYLASTAGSLIQHKKMQHQGIKFPCVLCDFAGETFDCLYKHIEIVHL